MQKKKKTYIERPGKGEKLKKDIEIVYNHNRKDRKCLEFSARYCKEHKIRDA